MGFHRDNFKDVVFDCECGCGDEYESGTGDLASASKLARAAGWRVYQDDGNWCHEGPACRQDKLPDERI